MPHSGSWPGAANLRLICLLAKGTDRRGDDAMRFAGYRGMDAAAFCSNARASLDALTPGQLQLVDDLTHTNTTPAAAQGLQAVSEHDPADAVKDFAWAVHPTLQIFREGNWKY